MYPENGSSRFVRSVRKFLAYMSHITVPVCTSCCCSCFRLSARYIQLHIQSKPRLYGIYCCSCSVFTICATCNVILLLKYVLYFYISTVHSMCAAPNVAVFCSAVISCFPGKLLRYCLSDFEMVPVTPLITGITFVFTVHMAEFLLWGLYILKFFRLLS